MASGAFRCNDSCFQSFHFFISLSFSFIIVVLLLIFSVIAYK
uniref:Uncharacterized protein n=1 Tax=Iridovirus sp. TaxID=135728 RepID=A0AAU7YCA2_9VIRU